MEGNTNWLMKMVTVLLVTAKLVSSQCTVGSILTAEGQPISAERSQYINLDYPAPCSGSITAWHFCYYNPEGEQSFDVEFRVWRPRRGRNSGTFERIHNDERTITSNRGSSSPTSLICEDITLTEQEYLRVRPDDVLGIYISIFTSISVVESNLTATNGAGVYEDTRSTLTSLLSDSIERNELRQLDNTFGLYLYADISTTLIDTAPPTTASPMATSSSTSSPPSESPNVNVDRQGGNNNGINEQTDGKNGGNKGTVIAVVVVVVLLLVGAGVIAVIVVVCLWRRNKSLNCFKGRENGLFRSIDNLIYRAGSDRIPFDTINKQESPYDIPRDQHDRTLYDIPKSLPNSSLNGTTDVEVVLQSEVPIPTAPPSHYLLTESPIENKLLAPESTYDIPRDQAGNRPDLEKGVRVRSIFDDPEYIYMSNESGTTDGDEEIGGNDDKATSDEDIDSNSEAYVSISYDSVEYRKLLKKATDGEEREKENLYSVPPSKQDEIYIVLSKQKIKVIPRNAITKTGHLGSGEYATVNKGVWKGSKGTKDVAVKTLSENATDVEKICLLQEAVIMGQFVHPNIVQLFGVVTHGDPIMIVTEHMPNGDLKKYLNRIRPEPGQLVPNNTPKLLLGFSQQVALGMHYLAGKGFVHRDLAARNIFVSEDNNCKIGDFGRSRDLTDGYYKGHGGKVPLKWTSPEAIRLKKYSTASDVWSYGCLLYEIWSIGRKPFKGISNTEAINKVTNGYRLPPPPGCPKSVYEMMIQCWHPAPATRPKYREILTVLLGEEYKVLKIPAEDASSSSQACLLGAPIEEGEKMYHEIQRTYLMDFDDKHDPDYEPVKKDYESEDDQ